MPRGPPWRAGFSGLDALLKPKGRRSLPGRSRPGRWPECRTGSRGLEPAVARRGSRAGLGGRLRPALVREPTCGWTATATWWRAISPICRFSLGCPVRRSTGPAGGQGRDGPGHPVGGRRHRRRCRWACCKPARSASRLACPTTHRPALEGLRMGAYTKIGVRLDPAKIDPAAFGDAVSVATGGPTRIPRWARSGGPSRWPISAATLARDLCRAGESAAIALATERLAASWARRPGAPCWRGGSPAWWTDPLRLRVVRDRRARATPRSRPLAGAGGRPGVLRRGGAGRRRRHDGRRRDAGRRACGAGRAEGAGGPQGASASAALLALYGAGERAQPRHSSCSVIEQRSARPHSAASACRNASIPT